MRFIKSQALFALIIKFVAAKLRPPINDDQIRALNVTSQNLLHSVTTIRDNTLPADDVGVKVSSIYTELTRSALVSLYVIYRYSDPAQADCGYLLDIWTDYTNVTAAWIPILIDLRQSSAIRNFITKYSDDQGNFKKGPTLQSRLDLYFAALGGFAHIKEGLIFSKVEANSPVVDTLEKKCPDRAAAFRTAFLPLVPLAEAVYAIYNATG